MPNNADGNTDRITALDIYGLSLSIGGSEILRDVSFDLPRGAFMSIVGPNGAGKTSLLRCVMRVTGGWSGRVRIFGREVGSYRPRDLARLVSYVPQSDEKWFPFTGRELVMMGRYPHLSPFTRPSRTDLDVVQRSLQITGTEGIADRQMMTLSGGERQKMFIAGALAQEARIMLLDEPTTFLDPRYTDEILAILARLNRSGVCVVLVTHDINQAALSADRIIALVGGRVAFEGPPSKFMDGEVLEAVYGKRFTLVTHPVTGAKMILPGRGLE